MEIYPVDIELSPDSRVLSGLIQGFQILVVMQNAVFLTYETLQQSN